MTNVFKGLRLPVIVAPMFLVSTPALVIEACKSGLLGAFPALNPRTEKDLDGWLKNIREHVGLKPFGVNLIVHKSNRRFEGNLKQIISHKVPLVITSLGASNSVIDAVHSYGGLVYHDVTNMFHAEKAAKAGVDGLIAVCAGGIIRLMKLEAMPDWRLRFR